MSNILLILLILAIIYLIYIISKNQKPSKEDDGALEDKFARISQDVFKGNTEQFLTLAKEVLGSQKNEIKIDLEGKKNAIAEIVEEIRKDLRKNEERITKSDDDRVRSFSALEQELKTYKEVTGDLKMSTEKLRNLLSDNQLRGAFGEQIAEDLLQMAGFVEGTSYTKNKAQQTQSSRPDFTVLLPDQTKINVDAKFPFASLVKSIESDNDNDKKRHFMQFKTDVKEKIKQVCNRDYINPEEKTVDFVILFIPNEMIFSYIYDKMNDVWEDGMRKKVVLAGPFSFTAILRMVKQAYTNFRYQENLQHIISLIKTFDAEYQKYTEEVTRLGERIDSASKQFNVVSNTRDKKLSTVVDKIQSQNIEIEQPNLLEDK